MALSRHAKPEEQSEEDKASFGFRQVDSSEKPELVEGVFRSVADRYDVMNDVMSCGIHRLWKDYYVSQFPLHASPLRHLDVAGGTGDIAMRMLDRLATTAAEVVVCDISDAMIAQGKHRADRRRDAHRLQWKKGDAEALPFQDDAFDSYSIAFGIRNVTHIDVVLHEAYRVLKPGGFFSCLEFSHVQNPLLRSAYHLYSFNVIPLLGQFIAGDRASYQYLVESIEAFPRQEAFAEMVRAAGFESVTYENLTNGVVAIHSGRKARR